MDGAGRVVETEDVVQHMISWDVLYHLGRANFDGQKSMHIVSRWDEIMAKSQGKNMQQTWERASYEYGKQVENLRVVGQKAEVTWKDTIEGSQSHASLRTMLVDFVICADGASSKMRRILLEKVPERP